MLERPMCCPNQIHNTEVGFNRGMDIIPDSDTDDAWYCMDCGKKFKFRNGISEMIRMPNERRLKKN